MRASRVRRGIWPVRVKHAEDCFRTIFKDIPSYSITRDVIYYGSKNLFAEYIFFSLTFRRFYVSKYDEACPIILSKTTIFKCPLKYLHLIMAELNTII